jgi:hypothetical protein
MVTVYAFIMERVMQVSVLSPWIFMERVMQVPVLSPWIYYEAGYAGCSPEPMDLLWHGLLQVSVLSQWIL